MNSLVTLYLWQSRPDATWQPGKCLRRHQWNGVVQGTRTGGKVRCIQVVGEFTLYRGEMKLSNCGQVVVWLWLWSSGCGCGQVVVVVVKWSCGCGCGQVVVWLWLWSSGRVVVVVVVFKCL